MKVAIITANTAVYKGNEEDASGKVMKHMLEKEGHEVVFAKALPGDRKVLATVMQRMADAHLTDLILTTGGAGCAMGDCTPEATIEIADRSNARPYDAAYEAGNAQPLCGGYQRRCADCEPAG